MAVSKLDSAIYASLEHMRVSERDGIVSFEGSMFFSGELEGPPGRIHGGIHPLVRTLPMLARIRGATSNPSDVRVKIDATLQKALPLGESVPFTGTYSEQDGNYQLKTRFLDSDRLVATATEPSDADVPKGEALGRFRHLVDRASREEAGTMRVIGVRYRVSASAIVVDLGEAEAIGEDSHLRRCIGADGSLGLVALSTQLDAVGASAQAVKVRHPHFTKHITLAFDTLGLAGAPKLIMASDRTTLAYDTNSDTPKVTIAGVEYGTARAEVFAVDPSFERCFAHGYVDSHPVDPSKYAGFNDMRKLRER